MKGITARFALVLAAALLLSVGAIVIIVAGSNQAVIKPDAVEQLVRFAESVESGNHQAASTDVLTVSTIHENEFASADLLLKSIDDPNQFQLLVRTSDGKRMALVSMNRDRAIEFVRRSDARLVFSLGVVLCIFALTAVILSWPLVSRIKRQQQTITRLAEGDLSARVDVDSNDAMGQLSQRINTMAQRIETLLGNNEWLLRTVSHEMRTPISRMHFSLQMLQDECKKSDTDSRLQSQFQLRMDSLRNDMLELDALLDELLTYSRLKSHDTEGQKVEELLLDDLLRLSGEQFSSTRPNVEFNTEGLSKVSAVGDARLLQRAFDNVVANACRCARSKVELHASMPEDVAVVSVVDDGPGIPAEDRERVFEPFVQLDSPELSRSGTGLGLAIVKKIIDLHGGFIRFEESVDGLNCCRIQLPSAKKT